MPQKQETYATSKGLLHFAGSSPFFASCFSFRSIPYEKFDAIIRWKLDGVCSKIHVPASAAVRFLLSSFARTISEWLCPCGPAAASSSDGRKEIKLPCD